jgi:hypothetical protein
VQLTIDYHSARTRHVVLSHAGRIPSHFPDAVGNVIKSRGETLTRHDFPPQMHRTLLFLTPSPAHASLEAEVGSYCERRPLTPSYPIPGPQYGAAKKLRSSLPQQQPVSPPLPLSPSLVSPPPLPTPPATTTDLAEAFPVVDNDRSMAHYSSYNPLTTASWPGPRMGSSPAGCVAGDARGCLRAGADTHSPYADSEHEQVSPAC